MVEGTSRNINGMLILVGLFSYQLENDLIDCFFIQFNSSKLQSAGL